MKAIAVKARRIIINVNNMTNEMGAKVAGAVVVGCIVLFVYLGFLEVKAEMTRNGAENTSCGEALQVAGYCCKSQAQYESGDCTK